MKLSSALFHEAGKLLEEHKSLNPLLDQLSQQLETNFNIERHGDLPRWLDCLDQLPLLQPSVIHLDRDVIGIGSAEDCPPPVAATLKQALQGLHPWRKGPFDFFGIYIDTEWRS